jgi:hypothetical protein
MSDTKMWDTCWTPPAALEGYNKRMGCIKIKMGTDAGVACLVLYAYVFLPAVDVLQASKNIYQRSLVYSLVTGWTFWLYRCRPITRRGRAWTRILLPYYQL